MEKSEIRFGKLRDEWFSEKLANVSAAREIRTMSYLIGKTHNRQFRLVLELRVQNRHRVLGRFDILRAHAWLGDLDPRVRGFIDQQRIELFVVVVETPVERIVYARPVQGLLVIVPQVLCIVMVARRGHAVVGRDDHGFLRDQCRLAVERAGVRRKRRVRRTIEVDTRTVRHRSCYRWHPRVILGQNASFLKTDKFTIVNSFVSLNRQLVSLASRVTRVISIIVSLDVKEINSVCKNSSHF